MFVVPMLSICGTPDEKVKYFLSQQMSGVQKISVANFRAICEILGNH